MIRKFQQFNENLILENLNESILYYSSHFKKFLSDQDDFIMG